MDPATPVINHGRDSTEALNVGELGADKSVK